jgi:hypothetical protein
MAEQIVLFSPVESFLTFEPYEIWLYMNTLAFYHWKHESDKLFNYYD